MGSTWGFSSLMKTPHVKFFEFLHEVTSTKICQVIVLSKIFFQDFRAEQCQNGPKMSFFTFYGKLFRLFCIKLQIDFNDFLERILDLRFFGPKGAQKGLKTTFFKLKSYPWIFSDFFGWSYSSIMTENWNEWYFWRNIFDFLHWLKIFLGRKFCIRFFCGKVTKNELV